MEFSFLCLAQKKFESGDSISYVSPCMLWCFGWDGKVVFYRPCMSAPTSSDRHFMRPKSLIPPPSQHATTSRTSAAATSVVVPGGAPSRGGGGGPVSQQGRGGGPASRRSGSTDSKKGNAAFDDFLEKRNAQIIAQLRRLQDSDRAIDADFRSRQVRVSNAPAMILNPRLADVEITSPQPVLPPHTNSSRLHQQTSEARRPLNETFNAPPPPTATATRTASTTSTERSDARYNTAARDKTSHKNNTPQSDAHHATNPAEVNSSPAPPAPQQQQHQDPMLFIKGVLAPLGLVEPKTEERLCSLLQGWLTRMSHPASSSASSSTVDDERALYDILFTTLLRTVYYCIHVLTPQQHEEDDDDVGTTMMPVPLQEAASSCTTSVHTTKPLLFQLTPRSWLFVMLCLAEMGYPRWELYTQVPSSLPPNNGGDATYQGDEPFCGSVMELLLSLLWLSRRYMLPAVTILVEVRSVGPFLFEHHVKTEDLTATSSTTVMSYPCGGDGWRPWRREDVLAYRAGCDVRFAQAQQTYQRCRTLLRQALSIRRWRHDMNNTTNKPLDGDGGDVDSDNDTTQHNNAAHVDPCKDFDFDDERLRAVSSWEASRHLLQIRLQTERHYHRLEYLLTRRATMLDRLGSSHSAPDFILCLPENADAYQHITEALSFLKCVPARSQQLAGAASGFMDILLSFQRQVDPSMQQASGMSSKHRSNAAAAAAAPVGAKLRRMIAQFDVRQVDASIEEDRRLMATFSEGVHQVDGIATSSPPSSSHNKRTTSSASASPTAGRHPASSASAAIRGADVRVKLEDDFARDDDDETSNAHTNAKPASVAKLSDVLARYRRTDAWEFYESKHAWAASCVQEPTKQRPPHPAITLAGGRGVVSSPTRNGVSAAAHFRTIQSTMQASMHATYHLGACIAAELRVLEAAAAKEASIPSATSSTETGDVTYLSSRLNHAVLDECTALLLRRTGVGDTCEPQPVLVGPPTAGRTTSARVEIHRLQQLMDTITSQAEQEQDDGDGVLRRRRELRRRVLRVSRKNTN